MMQNAHMHPPQGPPSHPISPVPPPHAQPHVRHPGHPHVPMPQQMMGAPRMMIPGMMHGTGYESFEEIIAKLQVAFPDLQEKTLATAVRTRKTYKDALHWLTQMQQQNMLPVTQAHDPQRRSIRQKFGQIGQYAYAPPPPHALAHAPPQQYMPRQVIRRPPPRRIVEREDSDSDVSEGDAYDPHEQAMFDERLLSFVNTASPEAIADVAAQPMELVMALVKKRPYASLDQAAKADVPGASAVPVDANGKRRRGAAKKPAGSKIIDAARTALRGYEAVDSLIKECAQVGKRVQSGIDAWGLNDETLETTGQGFFREQPKLLSEGTVLKNYQQIGVNWLSLLYNLGLSCILADEMGLGKTLQVIAFLAHLKEIGEPGPHLVVCPASTLENWLREFARFAPSLKVEPYYGSQPERAEIREELQDSNFEVLITTYNLATGGKQDMGFLKSLGFNVCVYDEGHLLKNSQSERYNKLMKLRARFRVLLTGTPLQNNLRELVSLLSFILPRLFEQNREDLLEVFKFKAKATATESEKSRDDLLSEQRIRKAKTMMTPFVMRRRKEQVLAHLPPKSHEVTFCDMTERQSKIYEEELNRNKRGLQSAKKQVEGEPATKKGKREAGKQLDNVLMQLRKAAIHPLMFRTLYNDKLLKRMAREIMDEEQYKQANEQYIFEDMQVMNDFELDRLCRQFPVTLGEHVLEDEHFKDSGKVRALLEILPDMVARGDRILLFSQFTQVLDILQRILAILDLKYLRLDGQTPVDMRQDMIDKFHEDAEIKVFLLSTKAGGFGINLAVANVVIIFDLSFNPHDDKQAEDRAHRVGQTRPVQVIRMITRNTIEENILDLANTKLALDKHVSEDLGEGEDEIDTEKEAYVAGQLLESGSFKEEANTFDSASDSDDSEAEPAPKRRKGVVKDEGASPPLPLKVEFPGDLEIVPPLDDPSSAISVPFVKTEEVAQHEGVSHSEQVSEPEHAHSASSSNAPVDSGDVADAGIPTDLSPDENSLPPDVDQKATLEDASSSTDTSV